MLSKMDANELERIEEFKRDHEIIYAGFGMYSINSPAARSYCIVTFGDSLIKTSELIELFEKSQMKIVT